MTSLLPYIVSPRAKVAEEGDDKQEPKSFREAWGVDDYFPEGRITPSGFGVIGGGLGALAGGLLPSKAPLWKRLLYSLGGAGLGSLAGLYGSEWLSDGRGWIYGDQPNNQAESPQPDDGKINQSDSDTQSRQGVQSDSDTRSRQGVQLPGSPSFGYVGAPRIRE